MIGKSVSRRLLFLGAQLQRSSRNGVRREHGCGFSNIGKCRALGTMYHFADKRTNTGAISNTVANKQKGSTPSKRYGILSTGLFLCGSSYGTMNYFANPEAPNVGKAVFSTYRPTQPLLEEDGHVPVYATSQANGVISAEIILYQYKICPFCNAVKALLDYKNIPYKCVEVNPISKEETKAWSGGYKKVPIMTVDGTQINDSMNIINEIINMLSESKAISTSEKELYNGSDAKKWAEWANKTLAVLLFPNITRNFAESWQAFSYISDVPHFGLVQRGLNRVLGPVAMWAAQGKIKKKYGIDDEREALFSALDIWLDEVGTKQFHGGDQPDIADIYTYGTIRALHGMDTHTEILEKNEKLRGWYQRMLDTVGSSSCTEWK